MSFQGTAENGVIILDGHQSLADGTRVEVIVREIDAKSDVSAGDEKPLRTSLAAWADANAENWGTALNSSDVEEFTGRRF